jgi:hypothetical protein
VSLDAGKAGGSGESTSSLEREREEKKITGHVISAVDGLTFLDGYEMSHGV